MSDIAVVGLWHLGSVATAAWTATGRTVIAWDADMDLRSELAAGRGAVIEPGLEPTLRSALDRGLLAVTADVARAMTASVDNAPCLRHRRRLVRPTRRSATRRRSRHLRRDRSRWSAPPRQLSDSGRHERQMAPPPRRSGASPPDRLRSGEPPAGTSARGLPPPGSPPHRRGRRRSVGTCGERPRALSSRADANGPRGRRDGETRDKRVSRALRRLRERSGLARARRRGRSKRSGGRAPRRPPRLTIRAAPARHCLLRCDAYARPRNSPRSRRALRPAELFSAVIDANERHANVALVWLEESLGSLQGRHIAVVGLTYKPGTSTLRDSLPLRLVHVLLERGATVSAWDPIADTFDSPRGFTRSASLEACAENADAVAVMTGLPEASRPWTGQRSVPRSVLS